jgi:hypothetical protein
MGSANAPFLVVAKEEASSYLPIPTWGTIQNFENNLDKPILLAPDSGENTRRKLREKAQLEYDHLKEKMAGEQ